ncbi:Protoporphyrinogen oxidase [Austwickia sp. TVS 96-490-7B]|uniref:protoporphyrinogen oxidase n=1 Tax=Austwickia sp. TVS 96-490-7B TaxID=2830843 RepID=UPI001C585168|nr:protoporphyrinogen oxidase [Austwickia sp. TVS 96-490-7B]MBW3084741.1 Protoporphyrinogen oxidase [Austwickia sp. TVS 96-490-7B]
MTLLPADTGRTDREDLDRPSTVAVVGGGFTGLVAARRLAQAGHHVIVCEASARLGGQICTVDVDTPSGDTLAVDVGAEALHTMSPDSIALINELGLQDTVTVARGGESYLWTPRGRRRLPAGVGPAGPTRLRPVLRSGVMTLRGMARAGIEPVAARLRTRPQLSPGHDVSVGDFVAGRFGQEVADRFVDPLLGGLHSGDVHRLSLRATTPTLVAAARDGRSLMPFRLRELPGKAINGAVNRATTHGLSPRTADLIRNALPGPLRPATARPRPKMDFLSWPRGLRTIVDRILTDVTVDIRLSCPVHSITATADGYLVTTPQGDLDVDAVVLAIPAWAARTLIRPASPRAADLLSFTRTVSTVTVVLGFPRESVAGIPALEGNGLLVPSRTGTLLKAVTNLSAKWPQYGGGDLYLMRLSAGRDGQELVDALDDTALVDQLRHDLRTLTGVDVPPTLVHVHRWQRGLPQLTVGHPDRIDAVRDELHQVWPQVALAGASYDGIGLAACLTSGQDAAAQIHRELTSSARPLRATTSVV